MEKSMLRKLRRQNAEHNNKKQNKSYRYQTYHKIQVEMSWTGGSHQRQPMDKTNPGMDTQRRKEKQRKTMGGRRDVKRVEGLTGNLFSTTQNRKQ